MLPGGSVRSSNSANQPVIGGRGPNAGLADPDAEAEEKELGEAGRRPAQSGETAPHDQRGHHDAASAGAIGKHRQWHTKHRVKDREGEASDGSELGVGELQVVDDRSGKDAEDLPIEKIEDIGQQQ
jgi:hypothetical protein